MQNPTKRVPGLLGVLSLDEVSRDRRHCYAILECGSLLGMGASKIRKDECEQKGHAKATDRIP
jgi:hypothetical protein